MSIPEISENSALELWQAQSLRLTAFPAKAEIETRPTWWKYLFGEPAEKITSQPKEFLHQEEGTLENSKFRLKIQPGRIDWELEVSPDLPGAIEGIPVIASFPKALNLVLPLLLRWLSVCPVLQRLAFGAKLIQPVSGHAAGYRCLNKYLPHVQLDLESSDFMYRINRRRNSVSGIPDLQINRLTTWSVLRMILSLSAGGTPLSPMEHYACNLQLDVNTSPESVSELPKDKYSQLFEELVTLGKEIAIKGDIA